MHILSDKKLKSLLSLKYRAGRRDGRIDALRAWLSDIGDNDTIHVSAGMPVLLIVGGNWKYETEDRMYTTFDGRMAVLIPPGVNLESDVIIRQ